MANDFGHKSLQNDGADISRTRPGGGPDRLQVRHERLAADVTATATWTSPSNIYSGTTWYLQHAIEEFYWVRLIDPVRTWNTTVAGWQMYRNMGSIPNAFAIGKKMGEGNSLLMNRGDGTFQSVGVDKGVNIAGWAWGSDAFDFDNDGDLDIHAVNGWISQRKNTDL